jgi:hypothetical protein
MIRRFRGFRAPLLVPTAFGLLNAQPGLSIRAVQGDGAINSIRLRRGHDPVVQVLDSSGEPIVGAMVTFLLPATGPSGSFGESGLSLTVQTDARGMAAARDMRPNAIAGQFRIRVTASWRGQAGAATVTQTNAEPVVKAGNSKKIAIIAIIAGVAAGGAAMAARGKSGAEPVGTTGGAGITGGGSIVAGSPAIGPPI